MWNRKWVCGDLKDIKVDIPHYHFHQRGGDIKNYRLRYRETWFFLSAARLSYSELILSITHSILRMKNPMKMYNIMHILSDLEKILWVSLRFEWVWPWILYYLGFIHGPNSTLTMDKQTNAHIFDFLPYDGSTFRMMAVLVSKQ